MKKNIPQIICNIALYVFMAVYLLISMAVLYMFVKDMIEDSSFDISIAAILLAIVILPWILFLLRNKIKSIYFIFCVIGIVVLFIAGYFLLFSPPFSHNLFPNLPQALIALVVFLTYLLFSLRFLLKQTKKLFTLLNVLYSLLLTASIVITVHIGYQIYKSILFIITLYDRPAISPDYMLPSYEFFKIISRHMPMTTDGFLLLVMFSISLLLVAYLSWSALFMLCASVHNVKIKPLAERELFAENDDKEQGGNVGGEAE